MSSALILALMTAAPSSVVGPRFVQADMLRVRAEPSASARVVARLSLGSVVELLATKGDWARIRTRSIPAVTGWALASLLDERPVDPQRLRSQLATAEGQARLSLLERLAAAEPASRDRQEELRTAYLEAGKPDAARQIADRLAGNLPTYFGSCLEIAKGRFEVLVLTAFAGRVGWTPLMGSPGAAENDALERTAAELGGSSWMMLKGNASVSLSSSPFPAPTVQTFSGAYGSEPARAIRLGACTAKDVGWSYVSGPIARSEVDSRLEEVKKELGERTFSADRWSWVRQVHGDHVFALAPYSISPGGERGVVFVAVPPAPRPVAWLGVATSAQLEGDPALYLAAGDAWEATMLVRYDSRSLQTLIPSVVGRSGLSCKQDERDIGGFSEAELEALSEFDARTAELESFTRRARFAWFSVSEAQPQFIAWVNVKRREVRCSDFPDLKQQLVLSGWTLPAKNAPVIYASTPLRKARAPDLAAPPLAQQIKTASGSAGGQQSWFSLGDETIGLIPFDEVVCESRGDDSICGGDTGFVVVLIRRNGKSEAHRVVTSTTGC